jgi:hypothetical protein
VSFSEIDPAQFWLYVREKIKFYPIFYILRIPITSCVGYLQKKIYSVIVSFVNAGAVKAVIFLVGNKSIFGLSSIPLF